LIYIQSSNIARNIPAFNEKDNVGNASRIMSLYRLRSLPVIDKDNKEVIGQISSKRIIKYMYDTILAKKIPTQKMVLASERNKLMRKSC
jgi:predicted transcriptional regulator